MLEKEAPLSETRGVMEDTAEGFARDRFGELGELGYLGMLLSEDQGGLGPIAFAVVMSELGRVAFPGPLLDLSLAVRVLSE